MTARLKGLPVTAAECSAEWVALRRAILVRDGQACRAGLGLTIEIKSLRTNEWHPLALPGEGVRFVSPADRDAVLAQLEGRA